MRAGGEPVAARPPVSIRLLGGIDVEVAGRRQSFSARTQLGLALCVLARRSNERVSTAELSDALWTHERPATYRNVIQVVISKLRAVVEAADDPAVELLALNDGYVLRCPADAVDACVFDSLVTSAMRELSGAHAAEARRLLADALGRWAEPFGGHEPEALMPYADQLRRRRREAESALLEVDIQLGVEDVEVIARAVDADPFDERLWGYLMIALYRRGRQADALRAFARARALLAEEVGVEPGPFLRAIEQEVLLQEGPHLRPAALVTRPVRTLTVTPPPAALTEVLFRSAECAALTAVLSRSRFVSLVGPPGVGKTTVAAEVARSWDATPVAWLGLGDVAATEAVLVDIALRLGVITEAEGLDDTHTSALQALIGDQPLLLVLDNVEHIAEAVAPFVTAVLQSCRNVTVLTTSRRELGEPSERIMPLRPFETGHDDDVLSSGAHYLALQADVDEPAGEELRTLNRIASDLGGIPLALDLAAAQVRRLGASVVGSHLDILPLARGSRLDESIAWSLEQLPPESRTLVGALVQL